MSSARNDEILGKTYNVESEIEEIIDSERLQFITPFDDYLVHVNHELESNK